MRIVSKVSQLRRTTGAMCRWFGWCAEMSLDELDRRRANWSCSSSPEPEVANSDSGTSAVNDFSHKRADRREYSRHKVSVQTELCLSGQDSPVRVETSDLSLGGCYIQTKLAIPAGTRLDITLCLGKEKVMISGVVVTCYPQFGNGIQFLSMPLAERDRVRTFLESSRNPA